MRRSRTDAQPVALRGPQPPTPSDANEAPFTGQLDQLPGSLERDEVAMLGSSRRVREALRQRLIDCSNQLTALADRFDTKDLHVDSTVTLDQVRDWLRHPEALFLACVHHLQQFIAPALSRNDELRGPLRAELVRLQIEVDRLRRELEDSRVDQERAQFSASHDALTGLPNRTAFEALWTRIIQANRSPQCKLGLLFIDINGFKPVNDLNGHAFGDELLKVIGSRLTHAVRIGDMVCRHGGDEFLCLLHDIGDPARCGAIAGKIFDLVSAPVRIGTHEVSVTPSVGIAMFPQDGTALDALIRSADNAMYWAKKHHLGHAFSSDLRAARKRRRPRSSARNA